MKKKACAMAAALAASFIVQGCGQRADPQPAKPAAASAPAVTAMPASDASPAAAKMAEEARKQAEATSSAAPEVAPGQPAEPASKWEYEAREDKMRGKSRSVASLISSDSIQQKFPYEGPTSLRVALRDDPQFGKDVMLILSQGQLPCYSYEGCSFRAKFDDGPIQHFGATGPDSGHGNVLFVSGSAGRKKFMSSLRKAKKIIIEVDVYDAGRQQFTFEPAGLKWEKF